jgi:biotin/methionine sulfoxide reductase
VVEENGAPQLTPLEDDPLPSRIGRGWLSAARDTSVRVMRPAVRKGWLDGDKGRNRNDDTYVEIPWDEALDLTANALRRVIDTYGNDAIYGGSYGWASAGRFHHAQSQLKRFLNLTGGFVAGRNSYSYAAAEVILPHLTGLNYKDFEDGMTSWPLIAEHCTLFLAFGGISTRTAQISGGGTTTHEVGHWMARACENGMKTINISPLQSDMAVLPGVRWLAVRPGSDVALMLALSYELVTNGWHSEDFLNRFTSGWTEFRSYLLGQSDGVPKSPEWAAPLCDLPVDGIRNLAQEMAREKVMVSVAWGLQRADHGEQTIWAGLALAAILGQIGQSGTGFGFGYGSTTPPGRPKRLVDWPSVPQGRNPVNDFIPVARLSDMLLSPGAPYEYNGTKRVYPDIRLVYWAGGNPFHHHQDLLRLEQAWTRPETVIVHEHSWTATARRADIVLPSTTSLERDDFMINRRDPELIYMSAVMPVVGEARTDHDILCGLADRMGVSDAFNEGRTGEDWLRWLWSECQKTAKTENFSLPDFDSFRAQGRAAVADQDETRVQFAAFVADPHANPLRTESGRITLFNQAIAAMDLPDCRGHAAWYEPVEWTFGAAADQLHLISNQPDTRLHSQLDNGQESQASKVQGREVCRMHSATARDMGLCDGDILRLHNDRGACLAALRTDTGMRRDCIVLPTGAWLDLQDCDEGRIDVHGNPNVLTLDKGSSRLTQATIGLTTLVRVAKWTSPVPEIRALKAPCFVKR